MRPGIDHSRPLRTAVITGGTSGIGREIARRLAYQDYAAIVIGRNAERGEEVDRELKAIQPQSRFVQGDLARIADIGRVATAISEHTHRIDVLVHNAGIINGERTLTPEGIDQHFAINYFSRFVLQQYLSPLMMRAPTETPAITLLISGAAHGEPIRYRDIASGRTFGVLRAVRQFCRANDLFALRLYHESRIGGAHGVRVACLKLGVVKTDIRRGFPWWMKLAVPLLFDPWLGQTPAEAADAAMVVVRRVTADVNTPPLFTRIRKLRPYRPRTEVAAALAWDELERFSARLLAKLRPGARAAIAIGS
jgi:NAD(P)-dependent dehydrogenase (short-subunit alcohol dehydrogenase family)